ncbi:MAG: DUF1624 domain-containing protein [Ignavibacteriales bacterium]|nr:DUF1624 domain-containing protein [Ignavibacteriales bacterium]
MTEQTSSNILQPSINIHPTLAYERIEVLDIIRGFAIFGILLVNMAFYNSPFYLYVTDLKWWTGTADQAAQWLIRFFAESKFYSLFSFLFGLGLALQMSRAEMRGGKFVPLYVRRLVVLLVIGGIHATLIWAGDILNDHHLGNSMSVDSCSPYGIRICSDRDRSLIPAGGRTDQRSIRSSSNRV